MLLLPGFGRGIRTYSMLGIKSRIREYTDCIRPESSVGRSCKDDMYADYSNCQYVLERDGIVSDAVTFLVGSRTRPVSR